MNRKEFFVASAAASLTVAVTSETEAEAQASNQPEFYELRKYTLKLGRTKAIDDYLKNNAIPAWRRAGLGPVGAFSVMAGPDQPSYYILLAHPNIASVAELGPKLAKDNAYYEGADAYHKAPQTEPAYLRIESTLMRAFSGMPKMEAPDTGKPRIFELRTYESHSKRANKKKIEMFDVGEIAIFRKTGLQPVFFGETMIGSHLPNLTYLLTFPDMETRDKNWGTFINDPEWKTLSGKPEYANAEIMTSITSIFLRPLPFSQI